MAVTTGSEYDHVDIVNGNNTNRHYLKDANMRENIIKQQATQPTNDLNRIWFPTPTPEGVDVFTVDDVATVAEVNTFLGLI